MAAHPTRTNTAHLPTTTNATDAPPSNNQKKTHGFRRGEGGGWTSIENQRGDTQSLSALREESCVSMN
jgi:hypothetical protein